MRERSRFIKIRVAESEYCELRRRADEDGLTMSEHVRGAVTTVHEATDVVAELSELRLHVVRLAGSCESGSGPALPTLEMLLLLRELAAARDAQILNRVRAQLAMHSGAQSDHNGGDA